MKFQINEEMIVSLLLVGLPELIWPRLMTVEISSIKILSFVDIVSLRKGDRRKLVRQETPISGAVQMSRRKR